MNKKLLLGVVLMLIAALVFINIISKTINELESYELSIKEKVGTKCYFDGDSILIIDYSLLNETYTLSNGIKVNINLVK